MDLQGFRKSTYRCHILCSVGGAWCAIPLQQCNFTRLFCVSSHGALSLTIINTTVCGSKRNLHATSWLYTTTENIEKI
eukprot:3279228-Amphidinium_carterae.1